VKRRGRERGRERKKGKRKGKGKVEGRQLKKSWTHGRMHGHSGDFILWTDKKLSVQQSVFVIVIVVSSQHLE